MPVGRRVGTKRGDPKHNNTKQNTNNTQTVNKQANTHPHTTTRDRTPAPDDGRSQLAPSAAAANTRSAHTDCGESNTQDSLHELPPAQSTCEQSRARSQLRLLLTPTGHKVNAFLLAQLERLKQLSVVSFLSCHTDLLHRNLNKLFLQRMSDSDVKSLSRKATMVLLDGDVSGLGLGAINRVLLFDHDSCQTSSSGRVTKNISDVVVAKHQ